jgi:hypothetical protein
VFVMPYTRQSILKSRTVEKRHSCRRGVMVCILAPYPFRIFLGYCCVTVYFLLLYVIVRSEVSIIKDSTV